MTAHDLTDEEGPEFEKTTGGESGGGRLPTAVARRARNGTLALLAGGLMLARAARAITVSRGRALVRGLVGAGLILVGLRQRRSEATVERYTTGAEPPWEEPAGTDVTITEPSEGTASESEATGEREGMASGVEDEPGTTEGGTSDEPGGPGTSEASDESTTEDDASDAEMDAQTGDADEESDDQ